MDLIHTVLLLGILVTLSVATTFNYETTFSSFTPFALRNLGAPQVYPFRPLFSYAYQAPVPSPLFTSAHSSLFAPASTISRMIYEETSASPKNNLFRGFSYQTQYTDGGKSEVIFVTGQESKKLMEKNLQFFRSILMPQSKTTNTLEQQSFSPISRSNIGSLHAHGLTGFQQIPTSIQTGQVFPAHTSPLSGSPVPLHSAIRSFIQNIGNPQPITQVSENELKDQYNVEAQESMINEVGTVKVTPEITTTQSEIRNETSSQTPTTSSTEGPSNINGITKGETEVTTDISSTTSANNINSNEAAQLKIQESTAMVEDNQSTTDDSTTISDVSSSTESQTEITASSQSDQNETTTNNIELSEQTTSTVETLIESN